MRQTSVLIIRQSCRRHSLPAEIRSWGHSVEVCPAGLGDRSHAETLGHDLVLVEADAIDAAVMALLDRAGAPVLLLLRCPSAADVVRALNGGADDIVAWDVEGAVLRARLSRLLARAGDRTGQGANLRERADIGRLGEAARRISGGRYHPDDLSMGEVASERVAGVAAVLGQLAEIVYQRQKRRHVVLRTAKGALLVVAAGAVFGIGPAIGRISSLHGLPPLGVVFWANVVAAAACLGIAIVRKGIPRLTRVDLKFLLLWAVVVGVFYQGLTAVVAAHVEASTMSLVASTRGLLVFLLAALLALEPPSLRRFVGLGAGFVAVAAILSTQAGIESGTPPAWLFAALILPALLAVHTLLMSWRRPTIGADAAVGLMLALSAMLLLPVATGSGAFFFPWHVEPGAIWIILALGASTSAGLVLALCLVACAGPVFAGQMAYSHALAGIAWGVVLLDETLPPFAWGAIAIVIAGFWLVAPRPAAEPFRASLPLPVSPRPVPRSDRGA